MAENENLKTNDKVAGDTSAPATDLQKAALLEEGKAAAAEIAPDLSNQDEIVCTLHKPINLFRDGKDQEVKEITMRPPSVEFYLKTGDHVRDVSMASPKTGELMVMPQRQLNVVAQYICEMSEPKLSMSDIRSMAFRDMKMLENAFDSLIEPF